MADKMISLVLLGAVGIEGKLYTRGAELQLDEDTAKNLLSRGKAALTKTEEASSAIADKAAKAKAKAEAPKAKG